MKNSKLLSLLTAGALVVSSFSGLAMNGGVARAQKATSQYSTVVFPGTAKLQNDGFTYQIAYGEKVSVATKAVNTNGGWLLSNVDAGVAAAAPVAGVGLVMPAAPTNGTVLTGAGEGFRATDGTGAIGAAEVEFRPTVAGGMVYLHAGDDAAVWANNTAPVAGTVDTWRMDVRRFVGAGATDITLAAANITVDGWTNAALSENTGLKFSYGTSQTLTSYVGINAADGFWRSASSADTGFNANNLVAIIVDAAGNAAPTGITATVDFANGGFKGNDRATIYYPIKVTADTTNTTTITANSVYYVAVAPNAVIDTDNIDGTAAKIANMTRISFNGTGAGTLSATAYNDIRFAQNDNNEFQYPATTGTKDNAWDEANGRYHGNKYELLDSIVVPASSTLRTFQVDWGVFTTGTMTVAKLGTDVARDKASAAATGFYAIAESLDPTVVVASSTNAAAAAGTVGAYGSVELAPRGEGTTNVRLVLYHQTAGVTDPQVLGEAVISVTVVAAPARTNVYVDNSIAPINTVVLNTNKDSADVYAEAITGSFSASKAITFYAPSDGYVTISDDDGFGHAKFESNGNGRTVVYAVPAALKDRFDASVSYWFSKNPYGTYVSAYDWAYRHNNNTAVSAGAIQPITVSTTGFTRKVLFDERTVNARNYVTTAKMVLNETRTFDLYLSDQAYTTGTPAAGNTKVSYALKADGEGATFKKTDDDTFILTAAKDGTTKITATATFYVNNTKVTRDDVLEVIVSGSDEPEPTPVHTAGEDFVDDETGIACHVEDDLTITVTAAPIVGEAITIPDTIDGLTVATIAPQAFKKSSAKRVYVFAPIDTLGKGAFKNSKVKKVYFYDPAALKTVGKNAFKKTNAKIVGVEAAFDESVAKDLKKAGAKSVKNNGTAK